VGYSNGLVIPPKGEAGMSLTITIESNAGLIVTSLAETSPIFVTLMSSNFCVPRTTFFVKDAGSKTNSGFRIDR
jgi:hypothetical protein